MDCEVRRLLLRPLTREESLSVGLREAFLHRTQSSVVVVAVGNYAVRYYWRRFD